MKLYCRKTAPKVKNGVVKYKNNWSYTPNIFNTRQKYPVIEKERPGRGYKHLLRKKDLSTFIDILPDWDELSTGLDAVLLAHGGYSTMGWYSRGIVAICAWDREIAWSGCTTSFYEAHKDLLDKLGVVCMKNGRYWDLEFNEESAKAFQLIHIFVHELGHHHDRMTTRSKRRTARGELYAEQYAVRYEDEIIESYRAAFKYI